MTAMLHLIATTIALIAMSGSSSRNADQRYPPLLQMGEAYAEPTQEQKLWALGTCAVLTESNRVRHDMLGGSDRSPKNVKACQDILAKWWGDNNREDLLGTLKWIEEGGHRRIFDEFARDLSAATPAQLALIRRRVAANPTISNRVEIALKYKDEFGRKSIAAWDYDRYVSLCGWGYIAGYLSEEEAWQRIMPAARLLQKTFDSWKDLGNNHVVGREFWSWKHTQERGDLTRKSYEKLLADPSSPWVLLKWDTDLSPKRESRPPTQPAAGTR